MGTTVQNVIERHLSLLREAHKSDKTIANHLSAFRAYIGRTNLDPAATLPESLHDTLSEYVAELPASKRDTKAILRKWIFTISEVRRNQGLPDHLPQALQYMLSLHQQTKAQLARYLEISPATIGEWVYGYHLPSRRHYCKITSLEQLWNLPSNSLLRLVTRYTDHIAHRAHTDYPSLTADTYSLVPDEVPEHICLEFGGLLAHKTDALLPDGIMRESRWSMRPIESYGRAIKEHAIIGGEVCVTAERYWALIRGYLGFLHNHKGYPLEALSIGLIANASSFKDFLHYIIDRRGYPTPHIFLLIQYAMALTNPRWGYIAQSSSFASKQNVKESAWKKHCERQHRALASYLDQLEDDSRLKPGRSVDEPIQHILSDREPLRILYLMESRLGKAKPSKRFRQRYLIWARDRLLLRMLITNPLRINHYSSMIYREDNTGHLRQNLSREWSVKFHSWEFKNSSGAAHAPYHVALDPWVEELIVDYLEEVRPHLTGANESDYLFLSARKNRATRKAAAPNCEFMMTTLSENIRKLSVRHIPEFCPLGMRAHSIRHIVATHLIKNGASIDQVASVLHDRASTVRKRYSHLTSGDGLHVLATHGQKYQ